MKHSFQRNKGMQPEQTEEEEVRQQTRMDEREPREGWMPTTFGGKVNCWRLIVKRRGSTQNGKYDAAVVQRRRMRRKSTRSFFDE